MKKTAIGLSLAALVLGSSAFAAPGTPTRDLKRDANGNGVLTRAEAQNAAATMFGQLDVNGDGKLDRADREARREATKTRMFERLDTNKDGQLTRAEFMAKGTRSVTYEGRRGGRHHGGAGRMMRTQGAGATREMTQAQFVAAALQRFDARDANKDGQVTAQERQQSREQRRAQRQQARAARAPG